LPTLFTLAPRSGAIYQQIIEQIRRYIAFGVLKPGEQLPTAKQLATDLTINPNTVVRAYRDLEKEGLVTSTAGRGTFVRDDTARVSARSRIASEVRSSLLSTVREAQSIGLTAEDLQDMFERTVKECFKASRSRSDRKAAS
jgi:GntR family transcriptional regulator